MNEIMITGRLTADPTLEVANNGKSVAHFRTAVDSNSGQRTDFFNVKVWGNRADAVAEHSGKGHSVAVKGELQRDEYTDKDGARRERYTILAQEVEFLARPLAKDQNLDGRQHGDDNGVEAARAALDKVRNQEPSHGLDAAQS